MGIWVRAQNRKGLKLVNDIVLCDIEEAVKNSDNPFDCKYKSTQLKAFDHDNATILGEYSTKERALQVLDEIQGHIWESVRAVTFPNDGYVAPIFEMPAE